MMGATSSVAATLLCNPVRVVKIVTQTSPDYLGYLGALGLVLEQGGFRALFFRGLLARLLGDCLQSIIFTILWKGLIVRWGVM